MGRSQSAPQKFEPEHWEPFQQLADNCILFHHVLAPDLHLECYDVTYPIGSSAQHDKAYQLRNSHPSLVRVLFREVTALKRNECWGRLFIERIPVRLSMFRDVPYPDALHIYSQALKGFQILAAQMHPFTVTEKLICLTQDSSIKVWINKDLSESQSDGHPISQSEMVKNILEVIEDNTDCQSLNPQAKPFLSYCCEKGLSFELALKSLESYAEKYFDGFIPKKLENIQKSGGAKQILSLWKLKQSKRLITETISQPPVLSPQKAKHNPFLEQNTSQELIKPNKQILLTTQAGNTFSSPIKTQQHPATRITSYPPQFPVLPQFQYIPGENVQQQIHQFYRPPSRKPDLHQFVYNQAVQPQRVIYIVPPTPQQLPPSIVMDQSSLPRSNCNLQEAPLHIQHLLHKKSNKTGGLTNSFMFSAPAVESSSQSFPSHKAQVKVLFNSQLKIPHKVPTILKERKMAQSRMSLPMDKLRLLQQKINLTSIKQYEEQEEIVPTVKDKSKEESPEDVTDQNENVSNGKKCESPLLQEFRRNREKYEKRLKMIKLENI